MLPRKNRLQKTKDISQIFLRGKFLSCDFLSFKYILKEKCPVKIAFSIGLAYSPKATLRNRAKRILRQVVQKRLASFPAGLEGVFFIDKKRLPSDRTWAEKKLSRLAEKILTDLENKHK